MIFILVVKLPKCRFGAERLIVSELVSGLDSK